MATQHDLPNKTPLNTFVIRFWYRRSELGAAWLGHIEHVQSGKSAVFMDFSAMEKFLIDIGVVLKESGQDDHLEEWMRSG